VVQIVKKFKKKKKCKRPTGNIGQSAAMVCSSKGKWVFGQGQSVGDKDIAKIKELLEDLEKSTNTQLAALKADVEKSTNTQLAAIKGRADLKAGQADLKAGQADLKAGQADLEDLVSKKGYVWGDSYCVDHVDSSCPIGKFGPANVLTNEQDIRFNETTTNYWLTGNGKTGVDARLFMYLGGTKTISGFVIKNTHNAEINSRATKDFTISTGTSPDPLGDWIPVLNDTLKDARNIGEVPVETFKLDVPISANFIRFEITSFYGTGGGLQYFSTF